MQVTFEIPEDFAQLLGENPTDLTKIALEGLVLEGLRSGKISIAQARRLLGICARYEMDGFLKAHEVFLPLTAEDIERDARTARAFRSGERELLQSDSRSLNATVVAFATLVRPDVGNSTPQPEDFAAAVDQAHGVGKLDTNAAKRTGRHGRRPV